MRLWFASLGVGLVVPALLVLLILTLKIVFPGATWGMFLLYFFVWPMPLLFKLFPGLGSQATVLIAFAVGTFLDIAIISWLSHVGFRVIQKK